MDRFVHDGFFPKQRATELLCLLFFTLRQEMHKRY